MNLSLECDTADKVLWVRECEEASSSLYIPETNLKRTHIFICRSLRQLHPDNIFWHFLWTPYHRVIWGGGCQIALKWNPGDTSVVAGKSVDSSPLGKLPDTDVRLLRRDCHTISCTRVFEDHSRFWGPLQNPKDEGWITSWPVTRYCVEKSTAETRSPSAWRKGYFSRNILSKICLKRGNCLLQQ